MNVGFVESEGQSSGLLFENIGDIISAASAEMASTDGMYLDDAVQTSSDADSDDGDDDGGMCLASDAEQGSPDENTVTAADSPGSPADSPGSPADPSSDDDGGMCLASDAEQGSPDENTVTAADNPGSRSDVQSPPQPEAPQDVSEGDASANQTGP